MTQETHLKLQNFISQNINAAFSELLFLQEQPGFAANRKKKSLKENPTKTQVYDYSSIGVQHYSQCNSPFKETAHP